MNFKDEDICTECGICCYLTISDGSRNRFFTPFKCQFLINDLVSKSKLCSCYETGRAAVKGCAGAQLATKSRILPTGCPYTLDEKDYEGPSSDYRLSPRVSQIVERSKANGPDAAGLYSIQGLKLEWDDNWNAQTCLYTKLSD